MPLRIRPFDHSPDSPDWAGQRALFERLYGPELAARRERALRWATLGNPLDLPEARRYVADDDGRIVASLGRMPVRFSVSGEPMRIRYSHDLLVDPAYRGQKLAQRLVQTVAESSDSPVGGLWMNAPSYAIHQRCGWRGMTPSHAQIRLLDAGPMLARRLPAPLAKAGSALIRGALALAAVDEWAWRRDGHEYEVAELAHFGAEADALWTEVAAAIGVAAVRDAAYLRWRFEEAPHTAYTRLTARREGALRGYAVLRLPTPGHDPSNAVIVDLLAPPGEPGAITALVREALARARAGAAPSLIAFTTLPAFRRRLGRLGFMRAPAPQTFVLSNIERSGHPEVLSDPARWYLTFTDSDGDMWTGVKPRERV